MKTLHYEAHNGTFQMDFSGSVVSAQALTGQNINTTNNAPLGIVGTASLNAVFSNGGTFTVETYQFTSGPWGNGPTPNNNYSAYAFAQTNESGMQIYGGTGWKVYLNDFNGRTGLRGHPDTNTPGTAGCIGFQGTATELKHLGNFFNSYFNNHKTMNFNFQIPNNPNYGNRGKANSHIGQ